MTLSLILLVVAAILAILAAVRVGSEFPLLAISLLFVIAYLALGGVALR